MGRPAILVFWILCSTRLCMATTATLVQPPDFSRLPLAAVLRVVDGDTVTVDIAGKSIECRLAGVDAAESRNADNSPNANGGAAARFLEHLLEGEKVYVAVAAGAQQEDGFGRTLAFLFRAPDGMFINLEMIRQGYARVFNAVPFPHREAFKAWEAQARAARKGIWKETGRSSSDGPHPPPQIQTLLPPGRPAGQTPSAPVGEKLPVFITDSGTRYHLAGCTALRKSRTIIPLADARKRYEPCRLCNPPR